MDKRCPNCKVFKPLNQFNNNTNRKDGVQSICRECTRTKWKEYRLRKKMGVEGPGYVARYKVIYDPLDSFTKNSTYTSNEIAMMLDNEYLAIGTKFRRGEYEYRVNEDMRMVRL
jgi:hypothetical protein